MGRPGGQQLDWSTELARDIQQRGYVAIGWPEMGDLSELQSTRDDFKRRFLEAHPDTPSPSSLGQQAGILFRFVHVLRTGEMIVSGTPGEDRSELGKWSVTTNMSIQREEIISIEEGSIG